MGAWANRWRTGLVVWQALLILVVVAGCGPQGERLGSRASADVPRIARKSVPPPPRCKPLGPEVRGNFIQWSRDGASIVFARGNKLYQAAADGSDVRLIDTERTDGWHAFDLSPDGRQIIYSGCQIIVGPGQYEIVRANIDGTWSQAICG